MPHNKTPNDHHAPALTDPSLPVPDRYQTAEMVLGAGAFSLQAKVAVTPGGLLAIAALVSSILVSTAVLVRAAKR